MKTNKNGMTLTEVLISALILAMVLGVFITAFVQTAKFSQKAKYSYIALSICRSRLERARKELKEKGFDALINFHETDSYVDTSGAPDTDGSHEFKRSTVVQSINTRLTRIDVSVLYRLNARWQTENTVSLTTMFTRVDSSKD